VLLTCAHMGMVGPRRLGPPYKSLHPVNRLGFPRQMPQQRVGVDELVDVVMVFGFGLSVMLAAVTVAPAELDVVDRVGGGDGFAAGFIYGLLNGETPDEAIKLGWAHGALLTTFPGDTTMATLDQVRAFAKGGSARIQR